MVEGRSRGSVNPKWRTPKDATIWTGCAYWLKYASEASYAFYLLHQSIVVAIGSYGVQWQMGIPQKFIIISTGAFGVTVGLCELIVRRFNLVRFCFGLKPIPPTIAQTIQE